MPRIIANMNANHSQKHNLGIAGTAQHQRQRRHHHPLRLEGPEQVSRDLLRRSLQRRSRRDQRNVQHGTRSDAPAASSMPRPKMACISIWMESQMASDVQTFTIFMRFLDQPQPGPGSPSTQHGGQLFSQIGCALCHTPAMHDGTVFGGGAQQRAGEPVFRHSAASHGSKPR